MIRIAVLILLFLPGRVYADGINDLGDRAIAATLKTLAKAFVQTMGVEKLKAKHIKSLLKMDEAKFHKRYAKVYGVIKDIPPQLRVQYGVREHMNKEDAIREIRRLDNKDVVQIIDAIPDQIIIKQVKNYLNRMADRVKDQDFFKQIDALWKKITQKA